MKFYSPAPVILAFLLAIACSCLFEIGANGGKAASADESDWRLGADAFKKNFPPGAAVPANLLKLLEFSNKDRDWFTGHFQLVDNGPRSALAWFDKDKDAAAQFIVFGREPDGSLYAFWMYKGRTLGNAPIVFLDGDGPDNAVIADSLDDFLALLGVGAEAAGNMAQGTEFKPAEEPAKRLPEFRAWLKSDLKIEPAAKPRDLIAKAHKNHPDLKAWIASWQKSRPAK